ncbi:zinc finger protein 277 isoform X3 [Petromyzon marinus]|uniref:Zinc finger protein 277 isoform X3 n=1 Tax=Petromyzon marinus TaxID=7757 RepID=A0AAJ7T2U3_PETMA|nr:zinc finger protein 277 isoform X3 [Petromyzon marinus]
MAEGAASGDEPKDGWHGDCVLEPLNLPESPAGAAPGDGEAGGAGASVPCALCDHTETDGPGVLRHMLLRHDLVVADVKLVADLPRYLLYWKKRFKEKPISEFCSVIRTNTQAAPGDQEDFHLLCDALPEDRQLRETLQQKRLTEVLEQQQRERTDCTISRDCLFCNEHFSGNRSLLLNHMAREHAFSIGLPDNLVYCSEFLDLLQSKLDSLCCLYCEKTFRDKNTLKDHMRKKQHRRINGKNTEFDRFYVINYLEFGKKWEEVLSEDETRDDATDETNDDDDWSDWKEHPVCAVCLFCDHMTDTTDSLHQHMQERHGFDLPTVRTSLGLRFYQQVKLVNFIRRQVHMLRCYGCGQRCSSREQLLEHMADVGHMATLPDRGEWDQPQYYFPTYENDTLLCGLPDSEDDNDDDDERVGPGDVPVIAEDRPSPSSVRKSSVLNQLLRSAGTADGYS